MKHKFSVLFFLLFLVLIVTAALKNIDSAITKASSDALSKITVILDAGHGGEDGGAVASDGTAEKDINLAVSSHLSSLFEIFGVPYIPVRTEDISVGDNTLETVKARKKSDIKQREKLVNETPGAVFFSIHQNKFEQSKYSGTQVFYGASNPESELLAKSVQTAVTERLQPDNKRLVKPSGKNIYLLYNAKVPSVMAECGFLSNPQELQLLKDSEYQKKMAYSLFCGLQKYLNSKEQSVNVK